MLTTTDTGKGTHSSFQSLVKHHALDLSPVCVETLQVNITALCNQACRHCRVEASPERTEQMDMATVSKCLEILAAHDDIRTLDITGGAPELNPYFDYFVVEARRLGKHVIVRHNLTVTFDGNPQTGEDKPYLPRFFAEQGVEVVASLPACEAEPAEKQRGRGVFEKSIEGIRLLNAEGYGDRDSGLILNLMYNPAGACLPEDQARLEAEFKEELYERYGLVFNKLYVMTNIPLGRFARDLESSGSHDRYLETLKGAFNPAVAEKVMCRELVNVGYDGRLYDCDINQSACMPIGDRSPVTVFDFDLDALLNRRVRFGPHCFACTAGGGST